MLAVELPVLEKANMLSDVAIRNAKPTGGRPRKLSDGGGLQLWVMPAGSKLWRVAYRFDGKQKKLSLGAYPVIGLKAARDQRDEAKRHLAAGVDPGQHKKAEANKKASAGANTFCVIADELLAKKRREQLSQATLDKVEWLLSLARPKLGSRPIADIAAPEILEVLRPIEASGKLETTKRMRSTIGEVFRLAVATGRASVDPTFALRGAIALPKVKNHASIIEPEAFGALLRAIDGYDGGLETRIALQLSDLLFPRPGELRAARWPELDWAKSVWSVPPERMKERRPHLVPLAPQAIALLKSLHAITGSGAFLFPSVRSASRCMSEGTLGAALHRLGYASDVHVPHGFRGTASTMLNDSHLWAPDVIETQLSHLDRDEVRRTYNRALYWPERVAMMAWWADQVDAFRSNRSTT